MSGFVALPNQTDFTTFLQDVVGIGPLVLPPTSAVIGYALTVALSIVNLQLANLPGNLYALAVFNLGADQVINFAQDQPGRTNLQDMRAGFGCSIFVPGVTASSGNSPTSQSTLNPDFMKMLTIGDLQNLKTPYGRAYLNFAQQFGSNWGMS